nr:MULTISPECIES: TonB-dependent receptor plug domain-containing protein [unclassified Brevundimonas]
MKTQSKFALMAGAASAVLMISTAAAAQQTAPQPSSTEDDAQTTQVEDIVVVGSQIRGASTTAALPVTVVTQEEIVATGAVSGDDLLRSIPQMGDVLFSSANNPQTSNAARGDVNSVNLRSLGVGNTLVLLNGRRIVQHPTSQGTSDTGTVPVLSYNSNAIPVSGLERLEVLLDGAAAIYGADAVAGKRAALLGGRGDRQLQRRELDRASGQSGPVDAGRLQSVQRRVRERHQLWRLHAQFPGGHRRHHHRSDAGVQDHPGPVGLQDQPARRLHPAGRAGGHGSGRRSAPRDPA